MKKANFGYKSANGGRLFLLCWAAYFSTYICRLDFSAVMPRLLEDGTFSQSRTALISSAFFICYGAGQLFSGALADRFSPRVLIFGGVFASGLTNILICFFSSSFAAVLLLWAANGIAQALVWAPILKLAGDSYDKGERLKFGVDISTTVPLGTLASYGVSLAVLMLLPWRWVFLVCGGIVTAVSFYWLFGTAGLKSSAPAAQKEEAPSEKAVPLKKLWRLLLASSAVALMIPIAIQGTLKDSVTQWIPTLLEGGYGMGTGASLLLTMLLPVINVTGAYIAKLVNKKLKNELATSAVFFAAAAVFLAALCAAGSKSAVAALICMAGVTNSMFAINVMLITIVPLNFAVYGRTGTVGGLLNAVAYIGCGVLNIGAGRLLEGSGGWSALFVMWLALALAAAVITAFCIRPWNRFSENSASGM